MRWMHAIRARLGLLFRGAAEERMEEEMRFHLEREAEKNVLAGMSPEEARRNAAVAFGGGEGHKEEMREGRPLARLSGLTLDLKLGLRMLAKHPGLTLIATLALAFAIGASTIAFEFFTQVIDPDLPLEDGDRVVAIVMLDAESGGQEPRTLHEFAAWRSQLSSLEDLGAARSFDSNLSVEDGVGEPVQAAEVTASTFRVARVQPLMGRVLVAGDEQSTAPPVALIGEGIWRTRFDSDPAVIGTAIRLGGDVRTIVGVMPDEFGFPVAHEVWVPFQHRAIEYDRRAGPAIWIFGRLAPGFTLREAQAELTSLGARAAVDFPETHEHLRPQVKPYPLAFFDFGGVATLGFASVNLLIVALLVLICGNVALLLFARAAARETEIIVRGALGASPRRIIGQLFVEALVLAAVAALIGMAAARFAVASVFRVLMTEIGDGDPVPFWFHADFSPETIVYVLLLTLIAAAVAGILPGLKVTRGLEPRLRRAGPGGGGLRFGGMWTGLIVTQVAVMALVPVFLFIIEGEASRIRAIDIGFPAEEYLTATIGMDRELVPGGSTESLMADFLAGYGTAVQELERRLEAEPGVRAVTFADRLPLMYHPHRRIEIDEGPAAPIDPEFGYRRVSSANVALDFFQVVDAPILAGRAFHSGDLVGEARTVIVNEAFVRLVLGGNNPVGRRLRYLYFEELQGPRSDNEPWYEIVGVVRDMGMARPWDPKIAGIYHPLAAGAGYPVRMAAHFSGDPQLATSILRSVAIDADPAIQLLEMTRLDRITASDLQFYAMFFWLTVGVSATALLLSLAGIYAVFAFTAARRTREVGIRIALGATPGRIVAALFRRPLRQIGMGLVLGLFVAGALGGFAEAARHWGQVAMYGSLIVVACLLATFGPVRRALRVEPTEALRADW